MNFKNILFSLLLIMSLVMGENVMANEVLDLKQHDIVMISSYTARGDLGNLEKYLQKSLDDGLTVNEIKEILVQMYAYCGFPRSLNALGIFMKVVNNRCGEIETGQEGKFLTKDINKNEYGTKVQTELVGSSVKGGVMDFAPAIDVFLKEHLFADIFGRGVLTYQEREIATIAALASLKGVEPQLNAHISIGKRTGITQEQVDEILNLTSGYKTPLFGLGAQNDVYAKYFKGNSYLKHLGGNAVNVTFEPGCRNNWHIHHKSGQVLLVTEGRGYYQEWGKPALELHPGDVVNIEPEVKHWHGAAKDSWFTHIAIEIPADGASNEWLEEVSDEEYAKLK